MKKNTYVTGKRIAIMYKINDAEKIIYSQNKDYSAEQVGTSIELKNLSKSVY